ncbi:dysbindin-A isoform X2 [Clupea harengus]|uniref:Dysbindin-A isoform X2 n=1 Tax=Clupea harengus TaxID=7950 RepID=A0A6P8G800_CLUHA|nr:dysbindin-A isoform X2 [Clupea harengus]
MSSPGASDGSKSTSWELDTEHAQKVLEMEHAQQSKLKERQKFFEEAFQQDMEQYLSTGYLQIADRREPLGSMSSMEVNVDMLEQMDLTDVSDHEALDVFLNSGGEDNSASSAVSGPAQDSLSTGAEISLKVPTRAELGHCLPPDSPSASTRSESASQETEGPDDEDEDEDEASLGDLPVVASDEEDVHPDTVLAGLPEEPRISDDSGSLTP